MNFSEVLPLLKRGSILYRKGWNGKNLQVYIHYPPVQSMTNEQCAENTYIKPHFRIWNKDAKTVDAWVPSVSDILAEDWLVVE